MIFRTEQDAGPTRGLSRTVKTQLRRRAFGCGAAILAFLLATLASQRVWAAEESSWAFLGFSDDGASAAVEVFGAQADGDSPYSTIRIIDTKTNQFAGPAITTCVGQGCEAPTNPNPTLKEVRTQNRQKAKEALGRFRIDANLQGERIRWSAKQRTLGQQGSNGMARETAQFRWLDADWTLALQEVQSPGPDNGHGHPRMIDLRLQKYGAEFILQKDKSVPKSRGTGIYSYELDAAIGYRGSLLVVLRYTRSAPHGPDISQLFVAAGAL